MHNISGYTNLYSRHYTKTSQPRVYSSKMSRTAEVTAEVILDLRMWGPLGRVYLGVMWAAKRIFSGEAGVAKLHLVGAPALNPTLSNRSGRLKRDGAKRGTAVAKWA